MLKLLRTVLVIGIIFAATLVMSPWRFGENSLHGHMDNVVEKTGTRAVVSKSQNAFESYTDNLRDKIPHAFNRARLKIATWINPVPSVNPKEQN